MARSRARANYTITAEDRTRAGISSARRNFDALAVTAGKVGLGLAAIGTVGAGVATSIVAKNADILDSYGKLTQTLGISVGS